jgi:hypothetical protein
LVLEVDVNLYLFWQLTQVRWDIYCVKLQSGVGTVITRKRSSRHWSCKLQCWSSMMKSAKTKISADAYKAGLGAVLLQQYGTRWRPVAYASRALTTSECNCSGWERGIGTATYMWEIPCVYLW